VGKDRRKLLRGAQHSGVSKRRKRNIISSTPGARGVNCGRSGGDGQSKEKKKDT